MSGLHPETERALCSIERAAYRRFPDLRQALAALPPEAQARAARDLYAVGREMDSLQSAARRAALQAR